MPRAARWWTIYKRLFYLPISHKSKTRMLDGMRVLSVTIFALLTTTFLFLLGRIDAARAADAAADACHTLDKIPDIKPFGEF